MSKFKKGDRVRVRAGLPTHSAVVMLGGDRWLNIRFDGESAEVAYMDHELELVPKFDFKVGDKVTTPGWSATPERFVTVEWIGPYQFAGETHDGKKVVHDFASANSRWQKWEPVHPFKVGDRVRNALSYAWPATVTKAWFDRVGSPMLDCIVNADCTWTCTPASLWEHYVEPSPVEPPKVKRWLVTTEERPPAEGETFVYAVDATEPFDTGCYTATCDFAAPVLTGCGGGGDRDVVTAVQPLTNLNDWIVGGDRK